MDAGWTEAKEPWERVRWARSQKFSTAKAAAESMGVLEGTYRAYEREPGTSKATQLDANRAVQFGKKFGVSWTWLLKGEGSPDAQPQILTPAKAKVMAAMDRVDEADLEEIADAIEKLLLLRAGA